MSKQNRSENLRLESLFVLYHQSMRTLIMFFLAIVLCLAFAAEGFSLESRVYKAPKESARVIQVWNGMDQTIECQGSIDKLSLMSPAKGLSKSRSWVRRADAEGNPVLFSRAQIRKLLDDDPHRDLLFVTIRGEHGVHGLSNNLFLELAKFTDELRYKRVVIIGWPDGNSIYVYRDTEEHILKSEERAAEKVK